MATLARPAAGAKKRNGVDRDMPAEAGFALDVAGGIEGAYFWMLWYLMCPIRRWEYRGQWVSTLCWGPWELCTQPPLYRVN